MKDRIRYSLMMGVLYTISLLPLNVLYLLSNGMFLLVYHLLRYRRKTVSRNLSHAFPEKEERDREQIERKFYRHLCDCIVETIKLLHISDREIDRRIEVTNGNLIEQLASENRPIILYMGHYCNWEWMTAITRHYTSPSTSGQIYRPLHDKVMERVMQKIRSRFHTVSIPQKEAFRTLWQMKQEGKQYIIAFIADQRPNTASLNHWTTFLHQNTAYSAGGDKIGAKIDANFIYLEAEKTRRGHYRISFKRLATDRKEAQHPYTLQFMKMLEATINRAPEYWLWSHKRWRFARPSDEM